MRYTNMFCGRYSLATGTRFIAWFYIVLYLINIVMNVAAVKMIESYKENVDENIEYNRSKLLTFHYISLTFGVVTIALSAAFLVKMSESEDFMQFMVKWNIVRCFFAFAAIIYACADMNHIFPVAISSILLVVDLCATTYFTGVMSSYIKVLEDPTGQIYSNQMTSSNPPSVHLVSHKRSLYTGESKVCYVNEVASPSAVAPDDVETTTTTKNTTEFVDVPLGDEEGEPQVHAGPDHDSVTVNNGIPSDDNGNHALNTAEPSQPQEKTSSQNASKDSNMVDSNENRNENDGSNNDEEKESEVNVQLEKSIDGDINTSLTQEVSEIEENAQVTEVIPKERQEIENPAVEGMGNDGADASETEPPCVVIIPASPEQTEQRVDVNIGIKK